MAMNVPMPEREWKAGWAELALDCAAGTQQQASMQFWSAHRLLAAAPVAWRELFAALPSHEAFAALLASGGELAAALALLEDCAGLLLSHGPGGDYLATVVFDGYTAEANAQSEGAALALLGAMAAALAGPEQPGLGTDLETTRNLRKYLRV